jgi:hypothetical protein
MPDLHGWLTRQIDATEDAARKAAALCGCHPPSPHWSFRDGDEPTDGRILVVDDPHPDMKRKISRKKWNGAYDGLFAAEHIALHDPAAVLRRCAADRKILARHQLDPDVYWEPACKGCGTYGDQGMPYTDNLNECPELLDLAEGYGITTEQLAGLDQPAPPERPAPGPGFQMPDAIWEPIARMALANVPPTLRGPNWKTTT